MPQNLCVPLTLDVSSTMLHCNNAVHKVVNFLRNFVMGSVLSLHRDKVLKHLHALDPVQVQLTQHLAERKPNRLMQFVYTCMHALQHWRKRRATIRALTALADWQLADIGVERGAIPAAVDRALRAGSSIPRNRLAA